MFVIVILELWALHYLPPHLLKDHDPRRRCDVMPRKVKSESWGTEASHMDLSEVGA